MNPNHLRSLEEAAFAIEAQFGPSREEWTITTSKFSREGTRLSIKGALPATMHFGVMNIDCETGDVTFTDEDHKDGGNTELLKLRLPEPWVARLRELAAR